MGSRRYWVAFMLFSLTLINYVDRATLSFAIGLVCWLVGLAYALRSARVGWIRLRRGKAAR